jgi:phosphoribosylformylglycinamidine (FGAM) synthase PurS component
VDALDPLALSERVAAAAQKLGIQTALIGASALAAHRYVRSTADVDFATYVDPDEGLCALRDALCRAGLRTKLSMPDGEDVLGGVLRVWEHEDEDGEPLDLVEIVNFKNPHRPSRNPAANAIRNAVPLEEGSPVRYVRIPDLVALKLYAGARRDLADIVELLVRNPEADLDEIREIAGPFDRGGDLETLIDEARVRIARGDTGR